VRTGKDVVHAVASGDATLGLTQATELIGAKGVQFAGYLAPEVQVVSVYLRGCFGLHHRSRCRQTLHSVPEEPGRH
jgi:hypothetical protein